MVTKTATKISKGVNFDRITLDKVLQYRQFSETDSQCILRVLNCGLTVMTKSFDEPTELLLIKLIQLFYANAEKIDFQGVTFTAQETALIERCNPNLESSL